MTFTLISSDRCDYCSRAAALLLNAGLAYERVYVEDAPWLKTIMQQAGLTTVPQIFRPDGQLIGGYTQLRTYLGVD